MKKKEEIIKILKKFDNSEYNIDTFCDVLGERYYFENSAYLTFHSDDRKYLDELVEMTERYSSDPEELSTGAFYSEKEIRDKFKEVLKKIC